MAIKGVIDKDIIAGNEFQLTVDNVDVLCTMISSIEESMQTVELPDGTSASGGRTEGGIETTVTIPAHSVDDVAYMDAWWASCKDPIPLSAYKTVTIQGRSKSGSKTITDTGFGVWVKGRKSAEYAMEDGGTVMTVIEYTLSIDDVQHSQ